MMMYETTTDSSRDIASGTRVQEMLDRGLTFDPPRVRSVEAGLVY